MPVRQNDDGSYDVTDQSGRPVASNLSTEETANEIDRPSTSGGSGGLHIYNGPGSELVEGIVEDLFRKRSLLIWGIVAAYFWFLSSHWNPIIEKFLGPALPNGLNLTAVIILLALLMNSKRIMFLIVGLFAVMNVLKFGFYFLVQLLIFLHVVRLYTPFPLPSVWPW